jgi:hypothetical protein
VPEPADPDQLAGQVADGVADLALPPPGGDQAALRDPLEQDDGLGLGVEQVLRARLLGHVASVGEAVP